MIVDSHCHLADDAYALDRAEVAARARAAGVTGALCILSADDEAEVQRAAEVSTAWPAVRFAAAVHPHRAGAYAADPLRALEATRRAVATVGAVALGEMGLDYHYDFAPRDVQRAVFAGQVSLAIEVGRPVIIHTREAADDTIALIESVGAGAVRGVMHCFTGTRDDARRALDLGFWISFSGILTFPRAGDLRDVARFVPVDRLLVETDAPYLAPVPHRGKRNEPAWVIETLACLAAVHGRSPDEMAADVAANFEACFGARATA